MAGVSGKQTFLMHIRCTVVFMLHAMGWMICGVVLLPAAAGAADPQVVVDSLAVHDEQLYISYHVSDLIDAKTINGLENGFTSMALHRIYLWKRKGLISQQISETVHPIRLSYDRWQQQFFLEAKDETRWTKSVAHVQRFGSQLADFFICPTTNLTTDAVYYLSIQVTLQPVSEETYEELRTWLSRSRAKTDSTRSTGKQRGQFFSLLLNVLGFGDRFYTAKSQDFRLRPDGRLELLGL
jgi:hypothetical protein